MDFFCPLFCKAQLCGVYGLKWSYGQILQSPLWSFAAPSRLSLVSLLPLIIALLAWSMSFGGRPSLGRFVVVPYSFKKSYNEFNGALWDVQSFGYFFYNPSCFVLLHNFVPDLFGELLGLHGVLLGGAPCLVVLQTLGPFRTGVYVY